MFSFVFWIIDATMLAPLVNKFNNLDEREVQSILQIVILVFHFSILLLTSTIAIKLKWCLELPVWLDFGLISIISVISKSYIYLFTISFLNTSIFVIINNSEYTSLVLLLAIFNAIIVITLSLLFNAIDFSYQVENNDCLARREELKITLILL